MVEYNIVNVKLSSSQINQLKSAVKSKTVVTLKMNIRISTAIIYLMNYY